MMQVKLIKSFLIGVLSLCMMIPVVSASQNSTPQTVKVYPAEGILDYVDTIRKTVSLDGIVYTLEANAVAYDASGKTISLRRLIKGTKVGVEFINHEPARRGISKFWVLPKSHKVKSHAG